MLVLSRNIGETIQIGENIEVQILSIARGQIRVGISAPREIQIVRTELLGRPHRPCSPRRKLGLNEKSDKSHAFEAIDDYRDNSSHKYSSESDGNRNDEN